MDMLINSEEIRDIKEVLSRAKLREIIDLEKSSKLNFA